jgi:hypothetical protein
MSINPTSKTVSVVNKMEAPIITKGQPVIVDLEQAPIMGLVEHREKLSAAAAKAHAMASRLDNHHHNTIAQETLERANVAQQRIVDEASEIIDDANTLQTKAANLDNAARTATIQTGQTEEQFSATKEANFKASAKNLADRKALLAQAPYQAVALKSLHDAVVDTQKPLINREQELSSQIKTLKEAQAKLDATTDAIQIMDINKQLEKLVKEHADVKAKNAAINARAMAPAKAGVFDANKSPVKEHAFEEGPADRLQPSYSEKSRRLINDLGRYPVTNFVVATGRLVYGAVKAAFNTIAALFYIVQCNKKEARRHLSQAGNGFYHMGRAVVEVVPFAGFLFKNRDIKSNEAYDLRMANIAFDKAEVKREQVRQMTAQLAIVASKTRKEELAKLKANNPDFPAQTPAVRLENGKMKYPSERLALTLRNGELICANTGRSMSKLMTPVLDELKARFLDRRTQQGKNWAAEEYDTTREQFASKFNGRPVSVTETPSYITAGKRQANVEISEPQETRKVNPRRQQFLEAMRAHKETGTYLSRDALWEEATVETTLSDTIARLRKEHESINAYFDDRTWAIKLQLNNDLESINMPKQQQDKLNAELAKLYKTQAATHKEYTRLIKRLESEKAELAPVARKNTAETQANAEVAKEVVQGIMSRVLASIPDQEAPVAVVQETSESKAAIRKRRTPAVIGPATVSSEGQVVIV